MCVLLIDDVVATTVLLKLNLLIIVHDFAFIHHCQRTINKVGNFSCISVVLLNTVGAFGK